MITFIKLIFLAKNSHNHRENTIVSTKTLHKQKNILCKFEFFSANFDCTSAHFFSYRH